MRAFSQKTTVLVQKLCETDLFFAKILEHLWKFLLILVEKHVKFRENVVKTNVSAEKQQLLEKISSLELSLEASLSEISEEKHLFSQEFAKFRHKLIEKQDIIGNLSRSLEEIRHKLEDSRNLEKTDDIFGNLMRSVNSFSGFLAKIDEENVIFKQFYKFF